MPSSSHAGVRPEVTPASPAWVSSWVTTRMRPSASSALNGGHTTTSRCEGTSVTRRAGPDSRTSESEIAARPPTPLMRSVSARAAPRLARHDDEVALAQPRPPQHVAHARVAGLERVDQPAAVDLEPARARSRRSGASGARRPARPPRDGARGGSTPSACASPCAVRTAVTRRAAAKRAPDAADAVDRADLEPRAAPADVGGVDGQLDVAQPHRRGVARRLAVAQALRAGRGRGVGLRRAPPRAPAQRRRSRRLERRRRPPRARAPACSPASRARARRRGWLGPPQPASEGGAASSAAAQRAAHGVNGSPGQRGGVAAGEPAQRRRADVGERAVVAAAAVALEAREQRRVLARVVRAGRGRVAAVVGGDDEQVARRVEALEPAADRGVDHPQRRVEARARRRGGRRPGPSRRGWRTRGRRRGRRSAPRSSAIASSLVAPGWPRSTPTSAKTCLTLPDRVHRHPVVAQLLEVGARGRLDGQVAAPLRAREGARLAAERPRDHAPDRVLAAHDLARGLAGGVELGGRHLVDVRGDLEHRVRRGVDDQVARSAAAARRSRRSRRCRWRAR